MTFGNETSMSGPIPNGFSDLVTSWKIPRILSGKIQENLQVLHNLNIKLDVKSLTTGLDVHPCKSFPPICTCHMNNPCSYIFAMIHIGRLGTTGER